MWLTRKTKQKILRMLEIGTPACMVKDGKPYKSEKAKLLDVLLTNKDYTPISKSDDHFVGLTTGLLSICLFD